MLTVETVADERGLADLAPAWDGLVRAMPRPSPFLLHGWLLAWLRHHPEARPAIAVARQDGELVGALPLCVRRRRGVRVLEFVGGDLAALADALVVAGAGDIVAGLVAEAESAGADAADLFGLPGNSRLAAALPSRRLALLERAEAPVLDLGGDWESVYRSRMSPRRRQLHRRRLRQLEGLGTIERRVAREPAELEGALEEAFRLHELRWAGRPDHSGFATPGGRHFHRDALAALAAVDVPRIAVLSLDGRAVAFHYYFVLERRMYVHRLAFDPDLARFSPGLICTLDAIEAAAAEGVQRVEFLGGLERYKVELADRQEPLYVGLGLARGPRGRAYVLIRRGAIGLRRLAKRSGAARRLYYDALGPLRRLSRRSGPD